MKNTSRSFVLWTLGGLIFLVAGIAVIKNLQSNSLPSDKAEIKANGRPNPQTRKAGAGQSLLQVQNALAAESVTITSNEQMISQIVGSERPFEDKVKDLLSLLPESKGSEQVLIASHLGDLAEGDQVHQLVKLLGDSRVNKKAKEEIFNTIYQCEPKQTASLLIQVIEDGVQEYADEAERGLSILLQADHGKDVDAWKKEFNESGSSLDAEKTEE